MNRSNECEGVCYMRESGGAQSAAREGDRS